jgi:hypothetical protein
VTGGGKIGPHMNDRSPARSILGGAVVVVLSGAAAFVGTRLAREETAPPAAPGARPATDPSAVEALERRLGYLEKRVDLVEETSRTALELARLLDERMRSGPGTAPKAAPSAEPSTGGSKTSNAGGGTTPPKPEPDRDDGADGQMAHLREIAKTTTRGRVVHAMTLFADASREGDANREAQANAEALALINRFGLDGDVVEDKIRKVFADQWTSGARDIGPIVHDGLGKADIATVRERLRGIYAETDKRLRPFFDDETWKQYQDAAEGMRKAGETVLDEFEKERLGGK